MIYVIWYSSQLIRGGAYGPPSRQEFTVGSAAPRSSGASLCGFRAFGALGEGLYSLWRCGVTSLFKDVSREAPDVTPFRTSQHMFSLRTRLALNAWCNTMSHLTAAGSRNGGHAVQLLLHGKTCCNCHRRCWTVRKMPSALGAPKWLRPRLPEWLAIWAIQEEPLV